MRRVEGRVVVGWRLAVVGESSWVFVAIIIILRVRSDIQS